MTNSRITREGRTVTAMISIYCLDMHGSSGLCPECAELKEYALKRLAKCPFPSAKPTCAQCTVHCYTPAAREKIKRVMRYAGPRIIYRHPVIALFHVIDSWRNRPKLPCHTAEKTGTSIPSRR